MTSKIIKIKIKDANFLPVYATEGSAGADLKAYIDEDIILKSHESILVPTAVFIEIPKDFEVQVRPRSSLALKHMVTVLNSPGTVDSDYRGELKVILINHSDKDFVVTRGMRIAQMVLCPVYKMQFEIQNDLAFSARGEGGFGSSGTH